MMGCLGSGKRKKGKRQGSRDVWSWSGGGARGWREASAAHLGHSGEGVEPEDEGQEQGGDGRHAHVQGRPILLPQAHLAIHRWVLEKGDW